MEEFDDLNKAWIKINKNKFSSSNLKKEEIMSAISKESSSTIAELKKGLKYKLYWVVFFVAAFVTGMMWNLNNPAFLAMFAVGFILYIPGILGLYTEYKEMDDQIDPSKDTLSEMKRNRDIVKRTIRNEQRWSFTSFPIIVIAVSVLPRLAKGASLIELLTDVHFMTFMIVALIVVLPIGFWAGKKLTKKGLGKQLHALDKNIKEMEEL